MTFTPCATSSVWLERYLDTVEVGDSSSPSHTILAKRAGGCISLRPVLLLPCVWRGEGGVSASGEGALLEVPDDEVDGRRVGEGEDVLDVE